MADRIVSIILDTTDASRNKRQKAVTNISPTATNDQLLTFANAVNALTTDTLEKVTRVEKQEITNGDDYLLFGPSELTDTYTSESATTTIYYNVINATTNQIAPTETFTIAVSSYDTQKATIGVRAEPSEEGNPDTNYAEIEYGAKTNEYSEARVTIAASGEFGSLSKICTIRLFPAEEI